MLRLLLTCLAPLMLGLTACSDAGLSGRFGDQAAPPPPPPPPAPPYIAMAESDSSMYDRGGERGQGQDAVLSYLAYSYSYSLGLPAAELASLHQAHADACRAAGPAVCQMVSASVNDPDGEQPSASLELRASPEWLAQFRGGIEDETTRAGGRVLSANTQVEDLTARIVDTEARVLARTTLRDRLQALLENRDADLGDLLSVERELANVQEDLDSRQSVLAALRQRVDTSRLTIWYQAERSIVTQSAFDPIMEALQDMGGVFASAVAALILTLAGLLPWLVIILPLGWLILRWIRKSLTRRKASRPAPGTTGSAPEV